MFQRTRAAACLLFATMFSPGSAGADEVGAGWNAWLTFSISPMAPASTVAPTRRVATK
ncbi:hypothetical protein V1292_001341 [Bradyrhizobium sp. AZCC 1719]|uniref:hypothetical protein n=1 Tax=Bradyrhizobium sp. AZCC 1719 TaxID=3117028 RepID=UPI002FF2056A